MPRGVFIMLSGFGLTLSSLRKGQNQIEPLPFWEKRYIRIWPQYAAIFLLFVFALHFGKLGSLVHPVSNTDTFLRLWGIGITDDTFFYINPSWWFVWFIIQIYLVFPWLYKLFRQMPSIPFLFLTAGATILFRVMGQMGLRFNESPYYWELGLFFGSRLAEFTVGMVLAKWIYEPGEKSIRPLTVLLLAIPVYAAGYFAQFSMYTRPVFAILTTTGMAGIMYGFWMFMAGNQAGQRLGKPLIWLGIHSYALFLFHQFLLRIPSKIFADKPMMLFLGGLGVLLISIPGSYMVEVSVSLYTKTINWIRRQSFTPYFLAGLSVLLLSGIVLYKGGNPHDFMHESVLAGFLLLTIGLITVFYRSNMKQILLRFLVLGTILAVMGYIFAFPPEKRMLAIAFGFALSLMIMASVWLVRQYRLGWMIPASLLVFLGVGEWVARTYSPFQSSETWGELPALEMDSTLVFKLIPNKETRLHYDAMDFVMKTNSFGMHGPEISPERPSPNTLRILILGDAISMPEGFPYPDAYPSLLEQKIQEELGDQPVQVINAAVTGYAPHQQVRLLPRMAEMFQPDIVVYQFFDEFIQNVDEELAYDPEFIKELQKGMGFFPEGEGPTIYDHIMRSQLVINFKKRLGTFYKETILGKPKPYRYHKALIPYFEKGENPIYTEQKLDILGKRISTLKETSESYGASFYMFFVPPAAVVIDPDMLEYFPWNIDLKDSSKYDIFLPVRHATDIAMKYDIHMTDLTPFMATNETGPTFFQHAWHMNGEGHQVMAQVIFDVLRAEKQFLQDTLIVSDTLLVETAIVQN